MSDPKAAFSGRWLPPLAWMFFIFVLSSVPGPDIPDLPIPAFHRVVHFIEYSVLAVLWLRAFWTHSSNAGYMKWALFSWVLTAVFAVSDEWHQTFVPGRSGRLEDVLFDVISATVGLLFFHVFSRKSLRRGSN